MHACMQTGEQLANILGLLLSILHRHGCFIDISELSIVRTSDSKTSLSCNVNVLIIRLAIGNIAIPYSYWLVFAYWYQMGICIKLLAVPI